MTLPIGPNTQAWLDKPVNRYELCTEKGSFIKGMIHEVKIAMGHGNRYRGKATRFTMRDYEYKDMVSLKQIYMNTIDEYECAMKAFGSWDHWLYLLTDTYFFNGSGKSKAIWTGIVDWREEKRLLEQNKAKKIISDLADRGNFAAAKMLFDNTIEKVSGAGRPSKEKILEKITQEAEKAQQVHDDMKRIRLAINNESTQKNNRSA